MENREGGSKGGDVVVEEGGERMMGKMDGCGCVR